MAQQLERDLKLSPRVNTTSSSSFNLTFPDMVAGKVLSANAGGTGLEFSVDASGLLTAEANASTSATNAANSATAAASSASSALNAKNAAEAALDTFDDDFLGSKASDPAVDNDGDALADGALYFNTTDNVMKVYDLGNTQWKQLTPTSSQQTSIDTVSTNITNVNLVGTAISTGGLSGATSFAERYRVASSAPTSSNDVGDLYFDTSQNELKVYKSSGYNYFW
jgi:hypothetical protein